MNPPTSHRVNPSHFADAIQASRQLHRSDTKCRYAMEIGAVGLTLMLGLSLFGGTPKSSNNTSSAPSTSYNPQSATAAAPSTTTGSPTVSQAQLNAIRQQAGGGSVISTVPMEPVKVTPVYRVDEAKTTDTPQDSQDSYTYKGAKTGPQPIYQDTKKEK